MDVNYFKRLVGDDKIDELFEALESKTRAIPADISKKIIQIKNRYSNLKNQTIIGLNPENSIRNQIIYALLEVIDEVEKVAKNNLQDIESRDDTEAFKIYETDKDELDAFSDALLEKFEFTIKECATNFKSAIKYSKYNLQEFAILSGIEIDDLNKIVEGKKLPTIEQIIRISKFLGISPTFFFESNYYGMSSIWKREPVKFVVFTLCHPKSKIAGIDNMGAFFSHFFYDLANALIYLKRFIFSREEEVNKIFSDGWFTPDFGNKTKISPQIKSHFSTQYYKLLEQVENIEERGYFTPAEQVIRSWYFVNGNYLSRVILEAVKSIEITDKNLPQCTFHFWDEIKYDELNGRSYDMETLQLTIKKSG